LQGDAIDSYYLSAEISYDPVIYYVRNREEKNSTVVAFSVTLAILFVIGICIAVKPYFGKVSGMIDGGLYQYFYFIISKKKRSGFRERVESNLDSPIEEQTELITTTQGADF